METEQTTELLKPCNKEGNMNICALFLLHVPQKRNLLIEVRKVNDPNPLYQLAPRRCIT
jgi:hypothetical protein